jgi:hypothetical protein
MARTPATRSHSLLRPLEGPRMPTWRYCHGFGPGFALRNERAMTDTLRGRGIRWLTPASCPRCTDIESEKRKEQVPVQAAASAQRDITMLSGYAPEVGLCGA